MNMRLKRAGRVCLPIILICSTICFVFFLSLGSRADQQQFPPAVQALLDRARAANPQRYQFALDKGAQIGVTADQKSFYLLWYPPNMPAGNRTLIVTTHGSASFAFDEFFLWYDAALAHGHGILALQWWFPTEAPPRDYYSPAEVHAAVEPVLKQQAIKPGRAMLHGFSRGSANGYYVALFDRQAKNNFFGLHLANAGGASTDYPLYLEVTGGRYGATPFAGMRWATFCGGLDPNPDRDGCPAMRRTADFIEQYGGAVDLAIEDQTKGHGGFHQTPSYLDLALTAFDSVLLPTTTTWTVKPDANFRIANASIPNVGLVRNEVWLTVGGQGGIRLFRSAQGDNSTQPETIPGLNSALAGTGYNVGEVIPREGSDGSRQLYVLGLGGPGANRDIVFRLRQNESSQFVRDPQAAVYSGAPADNQFLGVPDVYPANDGKLRLIYVARGATRQNSRTAISSDGGQSFAFDYDNPFNDLNVANPGASNTNVDPAVVKLAQGGYLGVTMRLKKLYLFTSADGRVFIPINNGAPIEASSFLPAATGFFDPTLAQLPGGKVLMYVTLEQPGQPTSVVRATLTPAGQVSNVSSASFRDHALAPESIVTAFGTNFAASTQSAASQPLPTTLAGATVKVTDSAGAERLAPLFFVSPAQINYLMPDATANGAATITVSNSNGDTAISAALISGVAPGLFSANANGQGVAAAIAIRFKPDGSQQTQPVARFDQTTNQFVAAPIVLGGENDQVFLVLFGTGLRRRSSLSNVSAQIGGADAQVTFVGAQGDFAGLDQINVRMPRSLVGRGEVEVVVTVDGQMANPVRISIGGATN
jgi:uncharacterized protein (TIGR03437 family)